MVEREMGKTREERMCVFADMHEREREREREKDARCGSWI